MNAIQTERLTKFYGKTRGITDLSMTVEAGDFFGFIGPNGAGKSTTIRLLLGLITPTEGNARVLDLNAKENREKILSQIGYLPSETTFYRGMRVRDILRFSARLRQMDCTEEAERLCHRLDLDPNKKVETLSLGNRKKVGIVCALQHKPSLYILDEPTSGLDPLIQKEFYELLRERNEEGATVFLSSHVLSEISRYCRHAAIIRDGALICCNRMEEMNHNGVKRVTLRGVPQLPDIPNAKSITLEGDTLRFLYEGEPQALLQTLSSLPFTDFTVADPDPEEIFLHFYQKEEA